VNARLALFDLDGTLVDSAPDIADAVNLALLACERAPLDEAFIRDCIGHGAERLLHRVLTGRRDGEADGILLAKCYAEFVAAYLPRVFVRSRLFDGVIPTLDALAAHGWLLGCVTNKPLRFTTPLLAAVALDEYFAIVIGGDSLPRKKPDALPLVHAANALGVALADVVMIGDSLTDIEAARAAGVAVIAVSFGYGDGVDLRAAGAAAVIDEFSTLLNLLAPRACSIRPARAGVR